MMKFITICDADFHFTHENVKSINNGCHEIEMKVQDKRSRLPQK